MDLRVEVVAAQRLLHQRQRVVLVVDHEAARKSEVAGVAAQDAHARRVEGGDPEPLRGGTEQLLDAFAHLAGGLVGEGHGQDLFGRDAAGADQIGDAVHEHARLAAARAREDQQRALGDLDRAALLRIQSVEDRLGVHVRRLLRRPAARIGEDRQRSRTTRRPEARRCAAAIVRAVSAERRRLLVAALVFVTALVVYAPVRQLGFVDYGDDLFVTGNPLLTDGLGWDDVRRSFAQPYETHWIPLTWISLGLDRSLYGTSPAGYHVTQALLHAASAAVLCLALANATGALAPAAFAAAAFAVHPLHVESVAWVSGRKDVLSGFFFLITLLAWVAYARRPGVARYAAVLVAFAAGLLAKAVGVTLPLVLLLLDFWPLARHHPPAGSGASPFGDARKHRIGRLLLEKVPLLGMAAAVSFIALLAQQQRSTTTWFADLPLEARIGNAIVSTAWYVQKAFWPTGLAVFHPYPGAEIPADAVGRALFALLAASLLAVALARRRPWLLVGWLWFLGVLVPMVGLVQLGMQARADRYAYLPLIGLQIAIAWEAWAWLGRGRAGRAVAAVVAVAVLGALGVATRHQLATWRDTAALFEHALRNTSGNFVAHHELGRAYLRAGDFDGAIEQLSAAARLQPRWPEPRASLGEALLRKGRVDEAVWNCREAVRLDPASAGLRVRLAQVLVGAGWSDDAIVELRKALRRDDGRNAARIHGLLGLAYGRRGDAARAALHLQQAIALDPDSAAPHASLGDALRSQGRDAEAIAAYRAALRAEPQHRDAANNLAWLLAAAADPALRAPDEALRWAGVAAAATQRRDASLLDTLAVSLAAADRFAEAVATLDEALALLPAEAAERRARLLQRRALFAAERPYVEAPRR